MLSGDPIILSNDVIIFVPQRERERERERARENVLETFHHMTAHT